MNFVESTSASTDRDGRQLGGKPRQGQQQYQQQRGLAGRRAMRQPFGGKIHNGCRGLPHGPVTVTAAGAAPPGRRHDPCLQGYEL